MRYILATFIPFWGEILFRDKPVFTLGYLFCWLLGFFYSLYTLDINSLLNIYLAKIFLRASSLPDQWFSLLYKTFLVLWVPVCSLLIWTMVQTNWVLVRKSFSMSISCRVLLMFSFSSFGIVGVTLHFLTHLKLTLYMGMDFQFSSSIYWGCCLSSMYVFGIFVKY